MYHRAKKMVSASLFTALCCLFTIAIQIPAPTGYINLGDCAVLLSGWFLGPLWGGAAAGLGSMLADILNGWVSYAPATFAIKFLMALTAAYLSRVLKTSSGKIIGASIAETIMVLGYFLYESSILGLGAAAAASIPANAIQGIACAAAGLAVFGLLAHSGAASRLSQ